MAVIKRKGNDINNVRLSFFNIKIWDNAVKFSNSKKNVYIYGEGKIGKALAFYFNEAGIKFNGHIQSDSIEEFKRVYKKGETGIFLGLSDWYYSEVLSNLMSFADFDDIFFIPETEKKYLFNQFTQSNIEKGFWLTVYSTYHCNLNCKSCLTHSPVCKKEFYEYEELDKDISRLKELGVSIHRVNFSGGEPMLNPHILDMFRLVRKEYPNVPTTCFTNGSLLHKLTVEELTEMGKIGVEFAVTEYPVPDENYHTNLQNFYESVNNLNVDVQIIDDGEIKEFYRHPYNLNGTEPRHSFFNCHRYRDCYMLCIYKGKLWKCYNVAKADEFNAAFGTKVKITPDDYVDLYDNITADDIYQFCMKRTPFCSYCQPLKDTFPWARSERKIEEWI